MNPISATKIEQRKKTLTKAERRKRSVVKWFSGGLTAALLASGVAAIKADALKSTDVQKNTTGVKWDGSSPEQAAAPSPQDFVGTWRLVTWENKDEEGNSTYPFGEDAMGYLMYSADKYMCVTLSKKDRPNFTGGDILTATPEEQSMALGTYISYCGSYDLAPGKVTHRPTVSLFPNYIGTEQVRIFRFENGKLVLTHAPEMMDGKMRTPLIVWEKVPQ